VAEIKGAVGAKYIIAMDPSWAENESSDFFAMIVFKLMENGRHMQVHTYAVAGGKLKDHINYFHYILTNFNIMFIVLDNAGGVQFLNSCNESRKFKDSKITLHEIRDVNFSDNSDYQGQLKRARSAYNLQTRVMVYMQTFNSDWILRANHLLQANINNKRIMFAGDPQGVDDEFSRMRGSIIPIGEIKFLGASPKADDLNQDYSENEELDRSSSEIKQHDAKMIDLIERQEFLIRLTKTQCALIEPKSTDGGHMSFSLPSNLKNQKGANKARKDLYTALLLGCWGVKCYTDMISMPEEKPQEWVPFFAK
jgi:hypothetical protein